MRRRSAQLGFNETVLCAIKPGFCWPHMMVIVTLTLRSYVLLGEDQDEA